MAVVTNNNLQTTQLQGYSHTKESVGHGALAFQPCQASFLSISSGDPHSTNSQAGPAKSIDGARRMNYSSKLQCVSGGSNSRVVKVHITGFTAALGSISSRPIRPSSKISYARSIFVRIRQPSVDGFCNTICVLTLTGLMSRVLHPGRGLI